MVNYIPQRGDFIRLNFDPQAGHEQMGTRPALVVSQDKFPASAPTPQAIAPHPGTVKISSAGKFNSGKIVDAIASFLLNCCN